MTSAAYAWRLLLILVVCDGAIRKWLLPDFHAAVFLFKDAVLLLFATLLILARARAVASVSSSLFSRHPAFTVVLGLYFAICALQIANPLLPNLALGLWGAKSHVLYAALVLLVPVLYEDRPMMLRQDLKLILVLGSAVSVLGIIQFFSPAEAEINRYAVNTTERIALFGEEGNARVTGTFAYISGMAVFAFAVAALATTLLVFHEPHVIGRGWLFATLALTTVVGTMTGSRWAIYVWATVVPVFAVGLVWHGVRLRTLGTLAAIVLVVTASAVLFAPAFDAFMHRAMTAGDDEVRLARMTLGVEDFLDEAGLVGFGVGATHQAAPYLLDGDASYWWIRPLVMEEFEDESSRVLVELGFVGFLAWAAMRVLAVLAAVKVARTIRRSREFPLAIWAGCVVVGFLTTSVIFNVTASFIFWYSIGLLLYLQRAHVGHAMRVRVVTERAERLRDATSR